MKFVSIFEHCNIISANFCKKTLENTAVDIFYFSYPLPKILGLYTVCRLFTAEFRTTMRRL